MFSPSSSHKRDPRTVKQPGFPTQAKLRGMRNLLWSIPSMDMMMTLVSEGTWHWFRRKTNGLPRFGNGLRATSRQVEVTPKTNKSLPPPKKKSTFKSLATTVP